MKLWSVAILLFAVILFVNGQEEEAPEELIETDVDSDDLEGFEGVAATGAGKIQLNCEHLIINKNCYILNRRGFFPLEKTFIASKDKRSQEESCTTTKPDTN